MTASNTGPPVRCSQLKWRTIDACDVIEHIAIRTASSQPAESRLLDAERGLDVHRGRARPSPRRAGSRRPRPARTRPGWHSKPASDARSHRYAPSPVACEVAGVRARHGHRRRGRAPAVRSGAGKHRRCAGGVRVRQRGSPRPAAIGGRPVLHRREPPHELVLEPGEQPLRGVGLVGGDVVGHHDAVDRDVRVPRDERDEADGARVGAARAGSPSGFWPWNLRTARPFQKARRRRQRSPVTGADGSSREPGAYVRRR